MYHKPLQRSIFLLFFCSLWVQAQDTTKYRPSGTYFIQLATTALSTSNRTAFWLQANQYGIIPSTPQNALLSAGVYYAIPLSKKWTIDAAIAGVGQSNNPDYKGIISEGYLRLKFKKWELYGGRKREYIGLSDTLLGMGSMVSSTNALPIPQVRFGTYDFIPIIGKWFWVKGYWVHGWFENSRPFVKNALLHQKGLYVRLGGNKSPLVLHAGVNHSVQWGGYAETFRQDNGAMSRYGYYENSWLGYRGVVSGMSMAEYAVAHPGRVIVFDQNRVGNHLGTIDLGLQVRFKAFDLFAYRQIMFEDGSLFYRLQAADSFNGLRWLNKKRSDPAFYLSRVTVEFLSTIDQGGAEFMDTDPRKRGRDNYFNNSQYQDGWMYFGRTLGTPFIIPDSELKKSVRKNALGFTNNRVEVGHLGLAGRIHRRTSWELKLSASRNYGTYIMPYYKTLDQFSGYLRIGTQLKWLKGGELSGAVAYDDGRILDSTLGGFVSFRKTGTF
ncbi:hypothetical protein BWI96_04170 [Siphonobacter sp. SORGH_AS_0500]|uniref:capsule assembly Wzi family protein n=1 Tax=Siphonobacter sp. SORGH_AS_0500 TaxID=1864824 RepID=UPI000CACFA02|nr:capsule assembly Wzi family protein [Siphonobacter sp. SORGH_AS_0500]PKK37674.1 hypothetical protein BWI96_04170 [Siphonobacter sp. SORGH_AS_0500]